MLAPLAVCGLLAGWIALSAANAEAANFSIFVFGFANLIVYTDALDFALRLYMRRRHTATDAPWRGQRAICRSISPPHCRRARAAWCPPAPFAIIASVFNLEDDLEEFMEAFGPIASGSG